MDRTNLLVIGAGLSRTGTSSLKVALEQLLGGPCYHGSVPTSTHPHHLQVWENARESGRLDDKVARSVLTGYLAAVDWPANFWHRELAEIFPHAKVVLTVRDARAWYRSVSTLHKCLLSIYCSWPTSWFHWLAGRGELAANIRHRLTAADLEDSIQALLGENEEEAVQRFLDHTEEVRASLPPSRLLVFDVRDGWAPLCSFLGLAEPSTPFPRSNSGEQVQLLVRRLRRIAFLGILGAPLLLAALVPLCQNTSQLCLSPFLPLLFLWGTARLFLRILEGCL